MRAVNCQHASPSGKGISRCALGLFNGAPTFGQCTHSCDQRAPRPDFAEPQPLTIGGIVHGAAGIAKAVLGIDAADAETAKRREAVCGACEHVTLTAGVLRRCEICGCALAAKVKIAGEKCPIGKW